MSTGNVPSMKRRLAARRSSSTPTAAAGASAPPPMVVGKRESSHALNMALMMALRRFRASSMSLLSCWSRTTVPSALEMWRAQGKGVGCSGGVVGV